MALVALVRRLVRCANGKPPRVAVNDEIRIITCIMGVGRVDVSSMDVRTAVHTRSGSFQHDRAPGREPSMEPRAHSETAADMV